MLAVVTSSNWQDVLIAYVPFAIALAGAFGLTRKHLISQDTKANKVKVDLDSFNGHTHNQLDDIQAHLVEIDKRLTRLEK